MSIPSLKKQSRARLAFYEAFLELLAQQNYSNISISDIVSVSGYSRSAFYSNFADKDDMLQQLLDYYTLAYVHSTYDAYQDKHDQINGSLYLPFISIFDIAYKCRKFYHQLFNNRLPNCNILDFHKASITYFRQAFKIRFKDWSTEFDWEMYWFVNGMNILNYIRFWDLHDWNFSSEYMAVNASLLMPNISVERTLDKKIILTKNMATPPTVSKQQSNHKTENNFTKH